MDNDPIKELLATVDKFVHYLETKSVNMAGTDVPLGIVQDYNLAAKTLKEIIVVTNYLHDEIQNVKNMYTGGVDV